MTYLVRCDVILHAARKLIRGTMAIVRDKYKGERREKGKTTNLECAQSNRNI